MCVWVSVYERQRETERDSACVYVYTHAHTRAIALCLHSVYCVDGVLHTHTVDGVQTERDPRSAVYCVDGGLL